MDLRLNPTKYIINKIYNFILNNFFIILFILDCVVASWLILSKPHHFIFVVFAYAALSSAVINFYTHFLLKYERKQKALALVYERILNE